MTTLTHEDIRAVASAVAALVVPAIEGRMARRNFSAREFGARLSPPRSESWVRAKAAAGLIRRNVEFPGSLVFSESELVRMGGAVDAARTEDARASTHFSKNRA